MHPWQEVVLIILCCLSTLAAGYCLIYLFPLKGFWQRVNSLGGGLKGIEAHVRGVRDEIEARLTQIEESSRAESEEAKQAIEKSLERVARDGREARRELERIRKDLQSLQAELRETAADARRMSEGVGSVTRELEQLRSDSATLDAELRASVRQLVADSYNSVESTVLSALEAVQEEMLYGTAPTPTPPEPARPRAEPARPGSDFDPGDTDSKIIAMEPLFAGLQKPENPAEPGAPDDEAADEPEDGPGLMDEAGEGEPDA